MRPDQDEPKGISVMNMGAKLLFAFSLGILSWGSVCAAQEYEFRNGYPTPETAQRVQDEQDYQRAVQSYRFFYPTVSMEGTFQGTRDAGAEDNKGATILAGGPRHVLFTGNSDTPYMGAVLNLKQSGPMVIELPAGAYLGVINDHHFRYVHDVGIPGPDAGNGGKHLILPPDYKGDVPAGYYTARSNTNLVYLAARALPAGGDMKGALDAQKRVKIYPLSQAANPPGFTFLDMTDKGINVTLLRWEDNLQFWEKLHKVLQEEPALEEFRPMYGMLAALGIEQGKPFAPDARMKVILERGSPSRTCPNAGCRFRQQPSRSGRLDGSQVGMGGAALRERRLRIADRHRCRGS